MYLACTKLATCLFKTSGGYVHNFPHVHQDTFAQRVAFEPKLDLAFAVMIIVYRWSRTTPRTQCTSMPNDHHRENHRQNQDQTCRNIRSTSGRAPFGRPCQKGPVEMCCIISLLNHHHDSCFCCRNRIPRFASSVLFGTSFRGSHCHITRCFKVLSSYVSWSLRPSSSPASS